MSSPISRRKFIGQASCAALGTTGLLSTLLNLGVANRVAASELKDYKALVCIFLLGGNDSFNMLVPTSSEEYECYKTIRGGLHDPGSNPAGLALSMDALLGIEPLNIPGRPFGLHPGFGPLKSLFDAGQMSFVSNIGSLQTPFDNVDEYLNRRAERPLGLFSHSDQQQQWQTCVPDARSGIGWAGRAMDILQNQQQSRRKSAFNISLSGMNIFQTGREIVPYTIGNRGLVGLDGFDRAASSRNASTLEERVLAARTEAVDSMMQGTYQNVFERTYARITRNAQDTFEQLKSDLEGDAFPDWQTESAPDLEQQLKLVASAIQSFHDTDIRRQTFFITVGGFDMHSELIAAQSELLPVIAESIGKFWSHVPDAIKPSVTLFTASDFARTLTGNGRGSDHAWGGNHFVVNGAMNGGHVFGDYPLFEASSLAAIDVGQGRLIPSYSVEEYFYPILKWFGLSDDDVFQQVFPGYAKRFGSGGIRKSYPLYGAA